MFGAKPLEDVVRSLKNVIMSELETALSQQVDHSIVHYASGSKKLAMFKYVSLIFQFWNIEYFIYVLEVRKYKLKKTWSF